MLQKRIQTAWLILPVATALSGCAGDRSASVNTPVQSPGRWEAVVMPGETEETYASLAAEGAWWDARRDRDLAVRIEGPLLATDQWPAPERTTLERTRYITLPTRAETIIIFRPEYWWHRWHPRHR
jgi:hypothetical protein